MSSAPRWFLHDWGQGGSSAAPSLRTPTPRSTVNGLTHADHFAIMKPANVASLRW